jgi:chromosome segregation ATPase
MQRVAVDTRLAGASEETKMNKLWSEFTQTTAQRDSAKEQLPAVSQAAAQANRLYSEMAAKRDAKLNESAALFQGEGAAKKITDEFDPKLKELQEKANGALALARETRERLDAAERALPVLKTKLDNQQGSYSARLTEAEVSGRRASSAFSSAESSVQSAAVAAEIKRLEAEKASAESQMGPISSQAATAQEYLSTVDARIASGTINHGEVAEMRAALASAQQQTALLQSFITRIGQEMSKQNEILRTLPSSH